MGWFVTAEGRNFLYYIGLVKKVHLGFSIRAHGKTQTNFLTNPIASWGKSMTNLGSILKRWDVILLIKVNIIKAVVFPVVTYRCESWTRKKAELLKNFWTVVLEKTLESPLDSKEIKPVNPKGNQHFYFDQNISINTSCLFCLRSASPISFDIIFQVTLKNHFKIPLFFPLS